MREKEAKMFKFHRDSPGWLLGGAMLAAAACPALAQDAGEKEYMVACAVCHGESGKGQGPFAELLNIETPSLTGLAAANDGEFPYLDVFLIVDGRGGVRGHGGSMPIWGERFSATAEEEFGFYGAEVVTRGRIALLLEHLISLQE